jgi:hypothetical protein
MIVVTVYNPNLTSDTHDFTLTHQAKSWLLLSGYLPTEEDEHRYVQHYTGCSAILTVRK